MSFSYVPTLSSTAHIIFLPLPNVPYICNCGGPLEHLVRLINLRNGFVTNNDASYIIKDDLSVLPLSVDARPLSLLGDMG